MMLRRLACVAGSIVGARNKVLVAEPLIASGEAARKSSHSPRGLAAPLSKRYSARLQYIYRQLRRLKAVYIAEYSLRLSLKTLIGGRDSQVS